VSRGRGNRKRQALRKKLDKRELVDARHKQIRRKMPAPAEDAAAYLDRVMEETRERAKAAEQKALAWDRARLAGDVW
jgi:hypothetical protein